jgi:antitoxin (DNA-binding transcriptional repressor) of toxin-antitoxin stability system
MSSRVQIAIQEAGGKLPDLVEQALRGGDVVITRDDQSAVRLVPLAPPSGGLPIVGAAKGTVLYIADDFDAPLDDFNEYT